MTFSIEFQIIENLELFATRFQYFIPYFMQGNLNLDISIAIE